MEMAGQFQRRRFRLIQLQLQLEEEDDDAAAAAVLVLHQGQVRRERRSIYFVRCVRARLTAQSRETCGRLASTLRLLKMLLFHYESDIHV